MKHIFKSILTLAVATLFFGACNTENEVLSTAIQTDKAVLAFDGVQPVVATLRVTADGDWHAYYPSWLTVEPANGKGNAEVTITAAPNLDNWSELMAPRKDNVAFWGADDAIAYVAVSQNGEPGLDATKYFKQIKTAEEFDPAFAYLLIAQTASGLEACQPCAAEPNNSKAYAYMYPTPVKANDEGVIVMNNGSLSFFFDAVEGGYAIRQGKGNYLWQSDTYTNFYNSTDITKANAWTVVFDEEGKATITNVSNNNKLLMYSTKYGNFDAGTAVADHILPTLWKDSAPPTDEELSVPENTSVSASATTASIAVTSNKTWKVRCHDSWVKTFTPSGTGDGAIEVTFDANTGDAARIATFKIIGETTNLDVTLTQHKPATCIADIAPMIISTSSSAPSAYEATVENAVVSYVNGNNAYIEDASGAILLYLKNHGLTAGTTISGRIFGSGYLYNGLPEITALGNEYTKGEGGTIPATEMTVKDLLAAYDANISRRIVLKGVKVTDSINGNDREGKIEQNGSSIAVYAQLKTLLLTAGSEGDIIVYPAVNNSTKRLSFWADEDFTPTVVGTVINVKNLTVEKNKTVAAGATTNSPAPISYTIAEDGIVSVDQDGTIHGLLVGETTVKASVEAVEGYSAAEASFKVTVTEPAPGAQGYIKVGAEPANWAGTYLLVVELEGGAKAFSGFSATATVYGLGADVASVSGVITNDETVAAYALQIAPATVTTGAYTIKWGDKFLNWTSGNSLYGVEAESANANWTLSFTDGHSVIRNAADNVRNLQWNASSPRFACYGNNNQTPIQLYKLAE